MIRNVFILLVLSLLMGWNSLSSQNIDNQERYNLAVYATGLQNDQPLSNSLLTVVQNKTITKLTGEGNYRLIERSNEFLRQIQNEQTMQQSGEVADGQIAELGAGYGAQKVCVVSVTIINQYLYIATRIVDVATKSSYESGDAEDADYSSIPVLTKTLDMSLDKMLSFNKKKSTNAESVQSMDNHKAVNVSSSTSDRPVSSQISGNNTSHRSENLTEKETKVQSDNDKFDNVNSNINFNTDFKFYKERLIKEKGRFLEKNSLAYKEYLKWRTKAISGSLCLIIGSVGLFCGINSLTENVIYGSKYSYLYNGQWYIGEHYDFNTPSNIVSGAYRNFDSEWYVFVYDTYDNYGYVPYPQDWKHVFLPDKQERRGMIIGGITAGVGFGLLITGIVQLSTMNSHLNRSYNYYLNGDQRSVSMQIYPFKCGNTFGAGLSLRF